MMREVFLGGDAGCDLPSYHLLRNVRFGDHCRSYKNKIPHYVWLMPRSLSSPINVTVTALERPAASLVQPRNRAGPGRGGDLMHPTCYISVFLPICQCFQISSQIPPSSLHKTPRTRTNVFPSCLRVLDALILATI